MLSLCVFACHCVLDAFELMPEILLNAVLRNLLGRERGARARAGSRAMEHQTRWSAAGLQEPLVPRAPPEPDSRQAPDGHLGPEWVAPTPEPAGPPRKTSLFN